jgi:hypothetical protein
MNRLKRIPPLEGDAVEPDLDRRADLLEGPFLALRTARSRHLLSGS